MEDWDSYENMAQSILNGHLFGELKNGYTSSFTYPYFVATIHWLFGPNMSILYYTQIVTLALAVALMTILAKKESRYFTLTLLSIIAIVDVSRWYIWRALSENLALLMIPIMFLALRSWHKHPFLSGCMLGFGVLTRFNWLPFVVLSVAYITWAPNESD